MRAAAFGSLIDNTDPASAIGGVLRAPMKHVGPSTADANFARSSQVPKEVGHQHIGVFVVNPDAAAEGNSGVANYLNKFGRTGTTEGNLQALRRGRRAVTLRRWHWQLPTASAVSGIIMAMKDGSPPTTPGPTRTGGDGSTDYSCAQQHRRAIGDVNTWNGKYFPGNTRTDSNDTTRSSSVAANEPDFTWRDRGRSARSESQPHRRSATSTARRDALG